MAERRHAEGQRRRVTARLTASVGCIRAVIGQVRLTDSVCFFRGKLTDSCDCVLAGVLSESSELAYIVVLFWIEEEGVSGVHTSQKHQRKLNSPRRHVRSCPQCLGVDGHPLALPVRQRRGRSGRYRQRRVCCRYGR